MLLRAGTLGRRGPVSLQVHVEPPQLLPQHVLDALPGPVAVVLERQQPHSGGAARPPHGLEEDVGLRGEGVPGFESSAPWMIRTGSSTWSAKKVGETWM